MSDKALEGRGQRAEVFGGDAPRRSAIPGELSVSPFLGFVSRVAIKLAWRPFNFRFA